MSDLGKGGQLRLEKPQLPLANILTMRNAFLYYTCNTLLTPLFQTLLGMVKKMGIKRLGHAEFV